MRRDEAATLPTGTCSMHLIAHPDLNPWSLFANLCPHPELLSSADLHANPMLACMEVRGWHSRSSVPLHQWPF